MATRSQIFVRTDDDKVTGTYCHWDGYPLNMVPKLLEFTYEELRSDIEKAQVGGGFSKLRENRCFIFFDDGSESCIYDRVDPGGEWCDYAYLMEKDGTVAVFNWDNDLLDVYNARHPEVKQVLNQNLLHEDIRNWPHYIVTYMEKMRGYYEEEHSY
jgi:hypothetical protein